MNSTTLAGITVGFALLILAAIWMTKNPGWLLNIPGLLIVLGGVFAATLGSFSQREVFSSMRMLTVSLRKEQDYLEEDIEEIEKVARLWFRLELKAVEKLLPEIKSPFLRTGVQLVIDNTPPDDINEVLQWRIERMKAKEYAEAQIFRAMASYAPAFGLLGTLLGLASMLASMQPGELGAMGASMAVALVTTFYGIALANLVFKPMAIKLERRTEQRVASLSMIMEAIALLHERRSPAFIRETLNSFTDKSEEATAEATPGKGVV